MPSSGPPSSIPIARHPIDSHPPSVCGNSIPRTAHASTAIRQPIYAVAAEDDHIAPWAQTFRINNHVVGERRFVLSSSGHILGIVNPPVSPPKRRYRVAAAHRSDQPEHWKERAEERPGSWWEDWMAWLKPRAGALVAAPPLASEQYPELAPAPGTYVLEH